MQYWRALVLDWLNPRAISTMSDQTSQVITITTDRFIFFLLHLSWTFSLRYIINIFSKQIKCFPITNILMHSIDQFSFVPGSFFLTWLHLFGPISVSGAYDANLSICQWLLRDNYPKWQLREWQTIERVQNCVAKKSCHNRFNWKSAKHYSGKTLVNSKAFVEFLQEVRCESNGKVLNINSYMHWSDTTHALYDTGNLWQKPLYWRDQA